jgi:hypothetical protein
MDNFDLKKFLKESKALENLNPSIKSINEGEAAYEYEKGKKEGEEIEKKKMTKEAMKKQIKDMIVAELAEDTAAAEDVKLTDPVFEGDPGEEESDRMEAGAEGGFLDEAKKDKEEDVEDVEVTDTTEEVPAEEMPAEEVPATGGLEDIAADMEGTEGDLMDHLMKAFQIAKGMGNEKLETQVGNTLKFFVSEYIGGGED